MAHTDLTILCEDNSQRDFILNVIGEFSGIRRRSIRSVPAGPDSLVLARVAQEIKDCEQRGGEKTRLVICIDADRFGVQQRCEKVAEIHGEQLPHLVVGLVPDKAIEHWVHELVGLSPLDGQPTRGDKANAKPYIPKAARTLLGKLGESAPPPEWSESLRLAWKKFRDLRDSLRS